jgi:hypothetical protein
MLQAFDLENLFFDKVGLREALATSIPSDIPAAVAYGSIESLVTLAAAAGCQTIFMDGEYPTCWAPGLQLNFRSHDSLGLVAAFTTYDFKPVYRTITEEDLKRAYFHSQGILKYAGKDIQNPFVVMNRTVRAKGAYGPIWIDEHVAADLYGFEPGHPPPSHTMRVDYVGGIWLLVGDVPIDVRVFPSANLQVHAIVNALAAQHYEWIYMSGSPRPTTSLASSDDVTLPGASFCMRVTGRYGEETFPDHVKKNKKTLFYSWLSNSKESASLSSRKPSRFVRCGFGILRISRFQQPCKLITERLSWYSYSN